MSKHAAHTVVLVQHGEGFGSYMHGTKQLLCGTKRHCYYSSLFYVGGVHALREAGDCFVVELW